MASREEKIAWAFEEYGPEGVYCDGEINASEAHSHAVDLYDRAHKTGGYFDCPQCLGTGKTSGYACTRCWTWGVVKK